MKTAEPIRKSRFAFLTLTNYSMIAVSNAVEPLRMANSLSGQAAYEWVLASLDGAPVPASNGLALAPTVALADVGRVDVVFVCGGINVREAVSPAVLAALRRLGEQRIPLGALCTGGYALARAGLLDRYRATIHWENVSALREEFPRVLISDQLFTIDRNRFTCSGGSCAARPDAAPDRARARQPDLASWSRNSSSSTAYAVTRSANTFHCVRNSASRIRA